MVVARGGVPMEVMGLMLGEFVDEYTVTVVDVFAMPQSGTGVSVEAVDHAFQTNMMDMLRQTGRPEMVVGWYHSHPGFGCWLSATDMHTQQSHSSQVRDRCRVPRPRVDRPRSRVGNDDGSMWVVCGSRSRSLAARFLCSFCCLLRSRLPGSVTAWETRKDGDQSVPSRVNDGLGLNGELRLLFNLSLPC